MRDEEREREREREIQRECVYVRDTEKERGRKDR